MRFEKIQETKEEEGNKRRKEGRKWPSCMPREKTGAWARNMTKLLVILLYVEEGQGRLTGFYNSIYICCRKLLESSKTAR
mmetsp:Transcript_18367/g.30779  ORF Transcript_18367/g.30779 Transcript_18367/m.30779 type:complete len:80 (-) Transcript_18367:89-328(-)